MKIRRKSQAKTTESHQFVAERWVWQIRYEIQSSKGEWHSGQSYNIVGDEACALRSYENWKKPRTRKVELWRCPVGPWEKFTPT